MMATFQGFSVFWCLGYRPMGVQNEIINQWCQHVHAMAPEAGNKLWTSAFGTPYFVYYLKKLGSIRCPVDAVMPGCEGITERY